MNKSPDFVLRGPVVSDSGYGFLEELCPQFRRAFAIDDGASITRWNGFINVYMEFDVSPKRERDAAERAEGWVNMLEATVKEKRDQRSVSG